MQRILMIFSVSVAITTSSLASPRTDIESNSVRDPRISLTASDAADGYVPIDVELGEQALPALSR
jgi:hypothetical protein